MYFADQSVTTKSDESQCDGSSIEEALRKLSERRAAEEAESPDDMAQAYRLPSNEQ